MRVRASRGLRIAAFYGHFFIRGVDLLALPNVAEDGPMAACGEAAHSDGRVGMSRWTEGHAVADPFQRRVHG